jgi:hypothetical protein
MSSQALAARFSRISNVNQTAFAVHRRCDRVDAGTAFFLPNDWCSAGLRSRSIALPLLSPCALAALAASAVGIAITFVTNDQETERSSQLRC